MAFQILASLCVCAVSQDIFLSKGQADPHERARSLLAQMTLEEKVAFTRGNVTTAECRDYAGCVPGLARLGIPALRAADGPQGYRGKDGTSTQWPSGMTMGLSWDADLLERWGQALGKEFRDKGANVLFGPAVNLHRVPLNGRNFEYISGEDPLIGRKLTEPVVRGIQTQGVIANVKHYIDNNQEGMNGVPGGYPPIEDGPGDRHSTSSNVGERTQMELYFPPFEGAVAGGVLSAMCGNNLINGSHACENNFTQNTMLREWGGFEGFIISDYRGAQSLFGSALGGLDLQLPGCNAADPADPSGLTCLNEPERPNFFGQPFVDAVRNGDIPESVVDDKVERILYAMIASGAFDLGPVGDASANVTSEEHNVLAREAAVKTAVLLQNNGGLLPINLANHPTIAVIGAAGHDAPVTGGFGSGHVAAPYTVTVLDGLRNRFGGDDAISYYGGNVTAQAGAAARGADYAVVVLAVAAQEGFDRQHLDMPDAALVRAVAAAQPNTVVVVAAPGPFLAPWADAVPSVLFVGLPGQEHGSAVAELLLGAASPSGKLSFTIPSKENEVIFLPEQYPGTSYAGNCTIGFETCYNLEYSERLEVGYRWYHAHRVTPKFPFGHGLTYSTFRLASLSVAVRLVSAELVNTGKSEATEVVQLYVTFPAVSGEPPRQLKGFQKVRASAGTKIAVEFVLSDRDLSIWDVDTHAWTPQAGEFTVEVGFSSVDLPLKGSLRN